MNREELEQEAEEKTAQYMAEHTEKYNCENTKLETDNYNTGREYGFEDGYLAAAEPREEQIEQLKQENVDLEKKNTALRQDWDVMKSTISDYEKENTELKEKLEGAERARDYWKDSSFDWRHKCTSRKPFRAAVKAQKQLSKAKELIEDMYDQIPASHSDYYKDVMERARQFIKELENE